LSDSFDRRFNEASVNGFHFVNEHSAVTVRVMLSKGSDFLTAHPKHDGLSTSARVAFEYIFPTHVALALAVAKAIPLMFDWQTLLDVLEAMRVITEDVSLVTANNGFAIHARPTGRDCVDSNDDLDVIRLSFWHEMSLMARQAKLKRCS
jgi:hypothetical protein